MDRFVITGVSMSENAPGSTTHLERVKALDGLRAIAVCAVLIYHTGQGRMIGGWAGVDIFFVLSGFLITSNLLREYATTGSTQLGRFYLRRFLRLTPALWALLFAVWIAHLVLRDSEPFGYMILLSATYTMNWAQAFDLTSGNDLAHIWSLCIEEQFYVLWPALFVLLPKERQVPYLVTCIIAIIGWRGYLCLSGAINDRTYTGFDTHSDGLLIGCCLAFLPSTRSLWLAGWRACIPFVIVAAVMLFMRDTWMIKEAVGLTVVALLSAWIILIILQDNTWSRVLSSKLFIFIGKISYSLYLWHYPIIILFKPKFTHFATPLVVSLSFIAAIGSYYLVERPSLILKNRFEPIMYLKDRSPFQRRRQTS